ncbi:MAG: GNAT family N-acetyltransferase [Thermomonas sp.]
MYRQVAALHAANIDQGFLATLGEPFLALMYRAIDEAPGSVLFVEEEDSRVRGFISGGTGMGRIYRCMLRRPVALCVALMPSVTRPSRIGRILDILRYGRQKPAGRLPNAELLSLAIAPEARGSGMAERLYGRLALHFRSAGETAFKITVGDALVPAHRFYTRMGALPTRRTEVHRGQGSTLYVHTIIE